MAGNRPRQGVPIQIQQLQAGPFCAVTPRRRQRSSEVVLLQMQLLQILHERPQHSACASLRSASVSGSLSDVLAGEDVTELTALLRRDDFVMVGSFRTVLLLLLLVDGFFWRTSGAEAVGGFL